MAPERSLAPNQTPPLDPTNPTLEYVDGFLRVKLPASGALLRTAEGLVMSLGDGVIIDAGALKVSLALISGLKFDTGKLSVSLKGGGALQVDSSGLSIQVNPTGGLQADVNGIAVKPAATGGLQTDANGLAIKHKAAGSTASDANGLYVKPVTIAERGSCPTLPNNAASFLNGVGAWAIPPGVGPAIDNSLKFDGLGKLGLKLLDQSLDVVAGGVYVNTNGLMGMERDASGILVKIDDNSVRFDGTGHLEVRVKPGDVLAFGPTGLFLKYTSGLYQIGTGELGIKLDPAPGLTVTGAGLKVLANGLQGIAIGGSGVGVKVDGATISLNGSGQLVGVGLSDAVPTTVTDLAVSGTNALASHADHEHDLYLSNDSLKWKAGTPKEVQVKLADYGSYGDVVKGTIGTDGTNGIYLPIGNAGGLTGYAKVISIKQNETVDGGSGLDLGANGVSINIAETGGRGGVNPPGDTSKYLDGSGNWTVPPGTSTSGDAPLNVKGTAAGGSSGVAPKKDHVHALALQGTLAFNADDPPKLGVNIDGDANKYLNGSGGWSTPPGVGLSSATPAVIRSTGAAGAGTLASKDTHYHALSLDTSYVDLYFDGGNILRTKRLSTATTQKALIDVTDTNGLYVPVDHAKGLIGSSSGLQIKLHATNPGLEFDTTNGMRMLAATTAARGGITLEGGGDTSKYLNGSGAWTPPPTGPSLAANTSQISSQTAVAGSGTTAKYANAADGLKLVQSPADGTAAGYASLQFTTSSGGLQVKAGTGLTVDSTGLTLLSATTTNIGGITLESGGTTKFLRQDGTWQAPGGGNHNMLSATHSDTTAASVNVGDLILGTAGSPNTWSKLAIGSNTYVLTSNGTTAGWQAPYVQWQADP